MRICPGSEPMSIRTVGAGEKAPPPVGRPGGPVEILDNRTTWQPLHFTRAGWQQGKRLRGILLNDECPPRIWRQGEGLALTEPHGIASIGLANENSGLGS